MLSKKSKHKKILEQAMHWLVKAQSASFSESDESEFLAWLASSPTHQAAYIRAEELWERGQVLDQVRIATPKTTISSLFSWKPLYGSTGWRYASLASILSIALLIGFVTLNGNSTIVSDYQTALGEQREVLLEDGSKVILNTDSSIRVIFERSARRVFLTQGEVFFDVNSDPKRPFDVLTEFGSVRVIGTQFTVLNSSNTATVTVLEGLVGLDASTDKNSPSNFKADITLSANQQLSLPEADKSVSVRTIDAKAQAAWRSKRIIATEQTLEVVIEDINRYFDKKIRLDNPDLAARKISAVIELGKFDQTLSMLENSLNVQSKPSTSENAIILY